MPFALFLQNFLCVGIPIAKTIRIKINLRVVDVLTKFPVVK